MDTKYPDPHLSFSNRGLPPLLHGGSGEGPVVAALAAGDGGEGGGAGDLLEGDAGVVGIEEPVEAPVAAGAQGGGHGGGVAVGAAGDAAVLGARQRLAELAAAAVEGADAAAGHQQVELVAAQIAARVGALHDHRLAGYGAGGEGQSVEYVVSIRGCSSEL